MISDEERREVAARLRSMLELMLRNSEVYDDTEHLLQCRNRAYRNIASAVFEHGNIERGFIEVVERVAELIDRPTCRDIGGEEGTNGEHYDFFC